MNIRRVASVVLLAMIVLIGNSCSHAQSRPNPQINWVRSPQMATSLARQFHLPILIFVESDSCIYCRKMEHDVWSKPDIIAMVESGFIPLQLNAERDAEIVTELKIRGFPTTLLFTEEGKFIAGGAGYQPPNQVAGLLRSAKRSRPESEEAKVSQAAASRAATVEPDATRR